MKLRYLSVEGFRSLRSISWEPGDLNLLVGPNASGKTNLLRMIDLLSAAAGGRLGEHVRKEGGILPLLWDGHGVGGAFRIIVGTSPAGEARDIEKRGLLYFLALQRLGDTSAFRIETEELDFHVQVEALVDRAQWRESADSKKSELFKRTSSGVTMRDARSETLKLREAAPDDETVLSMIAGPLANRESSIYRAELASWTLYEIIDTRRGSPIRQPALIRHEKRVSPSGDNLTPVLQTLHEHDIDFKNEIYGAMQAAFGDQFDGLAFLTAGEGQTQLGVRWKGLKRPQSAATLSDGTLRFLFLLTVLASEDLPPLIAIEEPEIGLHPSMFRIIAEFAAEAATRSQVFISTHSPEFLDAFRDQEVSTTVFESREGETVCAVLEGEELEGWLKEYRLGELHVSNELSIWLQRRVEEMEAARQTET